MSNHLKIAMTVGALVIVVCGLALCRTGCRRKSAADESKAQKKTTAQSAQPVKPAAIVKSEFDVDATTQTSGCEDNLNDVFFLARATLQPPGSLTAEQEQTWQALEGKVGFAVGKANTILITTDGGVTWRRALERLEKDGAEFTSVIFVSTNEGWTVDMGQLLHTTDSGVTWAAATKLPGLFYYYGPHALVGRTWFQMQPPTYSASIHKTIDGGLTWQTLPAGLPRNDFVSVYFLDENVGWVGNVGGLIAETHDGGKNWAKLNLPAKGDVVQFQFVNPDTGWIRMPRDHQGGLLKTTDGGKNWILQSAGIEPLWSLQDMQFLDDKIGFLLVNATKNRTILMRTLDGGRTWEKLSVHQGRLNAISFVNRNEGWAVGTAGCVLHYLFMRGE